MSTIINKSVEDKYEMLTDVQHVLFRPNQYVGNTNNITCDYRLYKPSDNKIVLVENIMTNDAILKFFDEVITNSIDESLRDTRLFDITNIEVITNKDGYISIHDNGGIPVAVHKKYGLLIPYMIFGVLRTSTNYQQDVDRKGAGLNGLGSKLANIFSTEFTVDTCDGKKRCVITWKNNMQEHTEPVITNCKEHGTRISFKLDLQRFEMNEIPQTLIRVFQKRCIDGAAGNSHLTIDFKSDAYDGKLNSTWKFDSFLDYVKMYLNEDQIQNIIEPESNAFSQNKVVFVPFAKNGIDIAYVNGAMCNSGSHLAKVQDQFEEFVLKKLAEKEITLITKKDIKSKYQLFIKCNIANPIYDSQVKTKLCNKLDKNFLTLSNDFLDKIPSSEIYNSILDYYDTKYKAEEKKNTRKLNTILRQTKSKKLISCVSGNASEKELWLFEGDSAGKGMRNYRNPQTQAGYLLRGKIKNTFLLTRDQVLQNLELREVLAALGLEFNNPTFNIKNCKFHKIVIATDMDFDGHHICGLFLAFFAKFFPELFKHGFIYRALSPVVIATKKNERKYFTYLADYEKAEKSGKLKGYEINYAKGLGSLEDVDYAEMLQNQKLVQFSLDNDKDLKMIEVWFRKETEQRKAILIEDGEITEDDAA